MKINRPFSLLRALRPTLIAAAALSLAACSISTPLGPIFGSARQETTTGSIAPSDPRFTAEMTEEDWQQTTAALQVAFDPKTASHAALWSNGASGRQGSIAAVADAYPDTQRLCRAFIASLSLAGQTSWYQGRACQKEQTPWSVVTSAPWTLPPAG
jgi:surface antigen